jgi:hypothetical protein
LKKEEKKTCQAIFKTKQKNVLCDFFFTY